MTVRPILVAGEPILATAATAVTAFDEHLARLVLDMVETNTAANGAGLAANQIGDSRAVFVYDCPDDTGRRHRGHVVNPVLETSALPDTEPDPRRDLEGCLSVPGERFPTGRASWARVTGVDIHGDEVSVEGAGFFARCLQHEVDHLAGRLYLSRLVHPHAAEAMRMLERNGWTEPGISWLPGDGPDPFAPGL
jgi:peptide deformylase